jgi:hypothetical protein
LSCLTISNKELENLFHIALANNRFEVARFFLEKDSNIIDAKKNGDRAIETCLQEFIDDENFMISYRYEVSDQLDIVNISCGSKIKFLVENNCEISEKFNQILTDFKLQNPDPDQETAEGMAIKRKLEFLGKIENLINERRSPNPLSTSNFASAQVVRAEAQNQIQSQG